MTTQYTPILKLALPVTGELSGTWGDVVNDNITSMVEQAIAGLATISTWSANSHTLTTANGTTSESRCAMLVAQDGAGLAASGEIVCPASSKLYVLKNDTSYAITLKTAAGTGVAVASGNTAFLFCDGTNVNACVTTIVDGRVTGNLTVDGNATVNGNTTLGNATSDTITATARFASGLTPSADNTYDLGSTGNSWKDLYIDGTAYLALVDINGGAIDGVSIGASTAATIINVDNLRLDGNTISSTDTNGNVVISPNGTGDVQLDADTVRVGDSGAAATLTSNGAGALTVTTGGAANLVLSTNSGTDSGTITIANGANGNISIVPNGTGDVQLDADTVRIGDANTDVTLTSNGTGNLNLSTNGGTNSGTIQIAQGANGNITLTPNGTGLVSIPSMTLSGGTANGVAYLNGSKVLTSGSALTFDGTNVFASSSGAGIWLNSLGSYTNGMYRSGTTDELQFRAGGSTRYQIDSTGVSIWKVSGSEQMRLTSTGLGIGTSSPTNALSVSGNANITGNTTLGDASTDTVTVNGYMGVGGAASASRAIYVQSTALTGTTQSGVFSNVTGSSAATSNIEAFRGTPASAAAAFTVANMSGLRLTDATKGAGSTITSQRGILIDDQTQGTNNYGIDSQVSSGSNKWNIYASGTAANYFAGDVRIGSTDALDFSGRVVSIHAATGSAARLKLSTATSGNTSTDGGGVTYDTSNVLQIINRESDGVISLATNATERIRIDSAGNVGIGTSSPTNALSVTGNANITGNTTLGDASTDTVQVNGYMGVGGAGVANVGIYARNSALTAATQIGVQSEIVGSSAATSNVRSFASFPATAAASFTNAAMVGFYAGDATKGAGSTITNQYGVYIADQTQGTNNYGITSLVSSGSNKWNIYASGTAANYFAGDVLVGTTTGRVGNSITPKMQLEGTSAATSTIMVTRDSADANPANLYLAKSRAGTLGGNTIVSSGDQLGAVYFFGADGTQMVPAAYINAVVDGTPGVNDMPGRLSFWTTPDGSPNPAERFRLGAAEAVFNDPGNDYDFRVESDTNTHALFVDAGNSRVGVNQSSPDTAFGVNGIIQSTGEASVVSIANGATATVITPNRGFSYINISRSDTASYGLLLLVFRTTTTLEIVSTVSDKTSATYSASVSGTALQITNSSGSTMSFYASGICIAFGTGD